MRNGFYVLDVDGHVTPEHEVNWNTYVPPPVARSIFDTINAKVKLMTDSRAVPAELQGLGIKAVDPYPLRPGGWDPKSRLQDMDAEGIDVAVLFPTVVASGATVFPHPLETSQAYNRWLADYCSAAPDRLKGVVSVPLIEGMDDAVKEMQRCVQEYNFIGVVAKVHNHGRTLADPWYSRLFAEAEAIDIPIMVHLGAEVRIFLREKYHYPFMQEMSLGNPVSSMIGVMDVICGGWLEKLKRLRFGFMEGELSWLPFWMDRLDRRYEKLPHHAPLLKKRPSEYLKDGRIFVSCEAEEEHLPYALTAMAEDLALFNSDYPHWDSTFSGTVQELLDRTDVTDTQKRKILSGNALKLLFGAKRPTIKVPVS